MSKIPKSSRNRSRRLRKKLYLDEFQCLGVEVRAEYQGDEGQILDELIDQIELMGWETGSGIGGGKLEGYICGPATKLNEKSLSEFTKWLKNKGCKNLYIGRLHDAYYS